MFLFGQRHASCFPTASWLPYAKTTDKYYAKQLLAIALYFLHRYDSGIDLLIQLRVRKQLRKIFNYSFSVL